MKPQSSLAESFSLIIAYILPGFTALQGLPFLSAPSSTWGSASTDPSLAGFLAGSLEAAFAGLSVSTLRWLVLDALHHRTGIEPPAWDFALLEKSSGAFEFLVRAHYAYYQFYANMVIALAYSYFSGGYSVGWKGIAYWLLGVLFFLGSRDALRKYYDRSGQLLRRSASPG